MTDLEIQEEILKYQKIIEDANTQLKLIKLLCKHTKTFRGSYSWRVGASMECDICCYCGEPNMQGEFKLINKDE